MNHEHSDIGIFFGFKSNIGPVVIKFGTDIRSWKRLLWFLGTHSKTQFPPTYLYCCLSIQTVLLNARWHLTCGILKPPPKIPRRKEK